MENSLIIPTKDYTNNEEILMFTEYRDPIGVMSISDYNKLNTVEFKGMRVHPWIDCVTCFIIDPKDKKVAVQLRGQTEIDPGEFDLCSGHVRNNELKNMAMSREMIEEDTMEGCSKIDILKKLICVGKIKMDFSTLSDNRKNNLRTFVSVYAYKVKDKSIVKPNELSVQKISWVDLEDLKNAIRTSMFRFPYTEDTKEVYEKIFQNIDRMLENKLFIGIQEYEEFWK